MGVIPNPKMDFIFPISCILALIFPILIKYFPKCERKGSFLNPPPSKITECVSGNGSENLGRVGTHIFFYLFFFLEKNIILCI